MLARSKGCTMWSDPTEKLLQLVLIERCHNTQGITVGCICGHVRSCLAISRTMPLATEQKCFRNGLKNKFNVLTWPPNSPDMGRAGQRSSIPRDPISQRTRLKGSAARHTVRGQVESTLQSMGVYADFGNKQDQNVHDFDTLSTLLFSFSSAVCVCMCSDKKWL